jgi:hypothetical protein
MLPTPGFDDLMPLLLSLRPGGVGLRRESHRQKDTLELPHHTSHITLNPVLTFAAVQQCPFTAHGSFTYFFTDAKRPDYSFCVAFLYVLLLLE